MTPQKGQINITYEHIKNAKIINTPNLAKSKECKV